SADISKADAAKALDAFISTISDVLKSGEQVAIAGFGTYKVSERAARKGRNPQTGAEIDIPAAKVP
ncbi:MAG TPA: DNA-binding protein HU, partial [Gammaproteobacteria bacterium]|nr:DNA-binding protein HU [Gammaproteobacteria bacterium]